MYDYRSNEFEATRSASQPQASSTLADLVLLWLDSWTQSGTSFSRSLQIVSCPTELRSVQASLCRETFHHQSSIVL